MRILVIAFFLFPTLCAAQQTLSRGEVVGLMRDYALCYQPDAAGACRWAEVYNRFGPDSLYLMSASAASDGTISVLEERLIWIDNALCLLDNAEGIVNVYGSNERRFDFQFRNIWDLDPVSRGDNIAAWAEGRPIEVCFRYARESASPDQLLQYTLIAGETMKDPDAVLLLPRAQGEVAIAP